MIINFRYLLQSIVNKIGPTGVEVDINDDSIDRWYVKHYKFDPKRNEVRHVILKAFSNQKAQMEFFELKSKELEERKKIEDVPKHEHISGGHYAPGYHARIKARREGKFDEGRIFKKEP